MVGEAWIRIGPLVSDFSKECHANPGYLVNRKKNATRIVEKCSFSIWC
jgi:hypothetical protein